MTIGIYALYWEEQDLIYIGQSQNIEARYREHLYKMKNTKHTNYKVQNTFDLYGEPILQILQECSIEKCNELEIYYTREFDSINNGLNIIEAGLVGWGVNSGFSKYTKQQVLKVFSLLTTTNLSIKQIALRCKVTYTFVQDVKNKRTHLWLKDAYPKRYDVLEKTLYYRDTSVKGTILKHTKHGNVLYLSPKEFRDKYFPNTRLESLREGVSRVIKGKTYQYYGFTLG